MYPTQQEQKLAGFTPSQHRRRPSLPTTPPETPMDGYFPDSARAPPPPPGAHALSIYPASPPATPVRASAADKEKERLAEREKTDGSPPSGGHRRAPSRAYAHHRRTSTATILRLALAGQAPVRGMVLTPSKAMTLLFIALSAGYLASFILPPLPGAALLFAAPQRRAGAYPPHFQKPPSFALPTLASYAHPARPAAPSPVGDTAQRKAWEEALSYRIPPQQHPVPVAVGEPAAPSSHDGELWRLHPELLGSGARPVRRRPLRMKSQPGVMSVEEDGDARTARDADDSFDAPAPASPPRRGREAERMHAAAAGDSARQAQLVRMKKVAVAARQPARVGAHVPIDSSKQMEAARAEQARVIVAGGAQRKKLLRSPGQKVQELEEDVRAAFERERELTRAARRPHARAAAVAVQEA
ncbi:hypothetical protein JCM10449v2_000863 [Rhodotorula kratochvilovae]